MGAYLLARARCFVESKKGQGMVEYALILVFVVGIAAVLASQTGIKEGLDAAFNKVTAELKK